MLSVHKSFKSEFFFEIYDYSVNHFHESVPKYSLLSCYHYTLLGSGVQSPVYLGGSARLAPPSMLPCSS